MTLGLLFCQKSWQVCFVSFSSATFFHGFLLWSLKGGISYVPFSFAVSFCRKTSKILNFIAHEIAHDFLGENDLTRKVGPIVTPWIGSFPILWGIFGQTDNERLHSCTAFLVDLLSPKKVTNLHTIKIRNIFQKVKKINPNPFTAVQRFWIFQK